MLDTTATLPTSARRETVWARALRDGLAKHGPTPTYDALVAETSQAPDGATLRPDSTTPESSRSTP